MKLFFKLGLALTMLSHVTAFSEQELKYNKEEASCSHLIIQAAVFVNAKASKERVKKNLKPFPLFKDQVLSDAVWKALNENTNRRREAGQGRAEDEAFLKLYSELDKVITPKKPQFFKKCKILMKDFPEKTDEKTSSRYQALLEEAAGVAIPTK